MEWWWYSVGVGWCMLKLKQLHAPWSSPSPWSLVAPTAAPTVSEDELGMQHAFAGLTHSFEGDDFIMVVYGLWLCCSIRRGLVEAASFQSNLLDKESIIIWAGHHPFYAVQPLGIPKIQNLNNNNHQPSTQMHHQPTTYLDQRLHHISIHLLQSTQYYS